MRAYLFSICCTATLCFASQAAAANIVNKDASSHQLEWSCDGAKTSLTLPAKAVQEDAIHAGCVVRLKKSNETVTVRDGDVLIVNGKLISAR